jgi:hypothetical protein
LRAERDEQRRGDAKDARQKAGGEAGRTDEAGKAKAGVGVGLERLWCLGLGVGGEVGGSE